LADRESSLATTARALRLQSLERRTALKAKERERRAILEAHEALTRSPLFNLIYNKISVGFSLLQFAEMLCQLNKPGADDARNVAERVYSETVLYAKDLPDSERPSALFHLGRFRTALDELKTQ
jgi:hypothetical protein